MQHLEIHILSTLTDIHLAETAGMFGSDMSVILDGPICFLCGQRVLFERSEKAIVVLSDKDSFDISCEACLTETVLAGMLGG
jgi:hypothetical protein